MLDRGCFMSKTVFGGNSVRENLSLMDRWASVVKCLFDGFAFLGGLPRLYGVFVLASFCWLARGDGC
jgi:hypothetical protein